MVNLEGRSDKSNLVSLGMVSLPRKTDAVIFVNLLSEEISTDQLNRLIVLLAQKMEGKSANSVEKMFPWVHQFFLAEDSLKIESLGYGPET